MAPAESRPLTICDPMRILILLRNLSPNGITTCNRMLTNELRRQGHEVFVWPSDDSIHSERRLRLAILHP